MSEIKLLPCPFCGEEAEIIKRNSEHPYVHAVWCKGCMCRTSFEKSENEAIEKWNTRKPVERIAEQLAKLSFMFELIMDSATAHEFASKAIEIVEKGGAERSSL